MSLTDREGGDDEWVGRPRGGVSSRGSEKHIV